MNALAMIARCAERQSPAPQMQITFYCYSLKAYPDGFVIDTTQDEYVEFAAIFGDIG